VIPYRLARHNLKVRTVTDGLGVRCPDYEKIHAFRKTRAPTVLRSFKHAVRIYWPTVGKL
jgi:hypothetical protein